MRIAAAEWVGTLEKSASERALPHGTHAARTASRRGQGVGHPGASGFALLPVGVDSFLLRMQMAGAAERTLDVQYFLIQSDVTGQLLIEALLKAADRGVRLRVLLDDAGSFGRDAQIRALAGFPNVELRLFNPFAYRGEVTPLHVAEYLGDAARLNYRMHNKLFVVDNEIAVVGGRNVGDEYFQGSRDVEFVDYDVVAAGPIVNKVSESFDAFWNSPIAFPSRRSPEAGATRPRGVSRRPRRTPRKDGEAGAPYMKPWQQAKPLSAMLGGRSTLVWAKAEVIYDSPEKAKVEGGAQAAGAAQALRRGGEGGATELIIVSPYFVPGPGGMRFFEGLRKRDVNVRILTNRWRRRTCRSCIGVSGARLPLLQMPASSSTNAAGPGTAIAGRPVQNAQSGPSPCTRKSSCSIQRVFVGSMNLDQRSLHLNTEIGLDHRKPRACAAGRAALCRASRSRTTATYWC